MLVQNETVPPDMRVWAEAQALIARGYEVSVICPRGELYTRRREDIDGVRIYRYPRGPEGRSSLGYLLEYAAALPPSSSSRSLYASAPASKWCTSATHRTCSSSPHCRSRPSGPGLSTIITTRALN